MTYANKHLLKQGDETDRNAPRRYTFNGTATGADAAFAAGDGNIGGTSLANIKSYLQPRTTADADADKESILDKLGDGGAVVDIYSNDKKFVSVLVVRDDTQGVTAAAGSGIDAAVLNTNGATGGVSAAAS